MIILANNLDCPVNFGTTPPVGSGNIAPGGVNTLQGPAQTGFFVSGTTLKKFNAEENTTYTIGLTSSKS